MKIQFGCLGILLCVTTMSAHADVMVISQDEFRGTGSHVKTKVAPLTDTLVPTAYTHAAFPQTSTNSVTQDSAGLHVLVQQTGQFNSFDPNRSLQYSISQSWIVYGFSVQFQVTAPESYSLTSQITPWTPEYIYDLEGPNGTVFTASEGSKAKSGSLLPGVYTLSGVSQTNGPFDLLYQSYLSDTIGSFNITPEPSSFSLLVFGGAALLLLHRKRVTT